jgi:creatinine amidohydrolase
MTITLTRVSACAVVLALLVTVVAEGAEPKGRLLSRMTWMEAKAALTPDTVVVIPVGAESKEHGLHLPLNTDFRQAEFYRDRVLAAADVVITPIMNYSYYPAFVEYPGSTSVNLPVAREMLLDVVRGIARFGPRRFYVINIGVSTNKPLADAAALLAIEGVLLRYLDLTGAAVKAAEKPVLTQTEGTHADEIETSVMLAIDASVVDMKKATVDYMPGAPPRGIFSPEPKPGMRYSASGVYGDATLATRAKGRTIVDGLTRVILESIEELRRATPPPPVALFGNLGQPAATPAEPKMQPAK